MSKSKHNIWYYLKQGGIFAASTAIAFLPEILGQFADHTLAFKIAMPISIAWQTTKLRDNYMKNTLPNMMTKFLDKVPDGVTGVKGSKLPSGINNNLNNQKEN